jgi:hypothetical protein
MNPVRIFTPHFFEVHFNVILPHLPKSMKWPLPFTIVLQTNFSFLILYTSYSMLTLVWFCYLVWFILGVFTLHETQMLRWVWLWMSCVYVLWGLIYGHCNLKLFISSTDNRSWYSEETSYMVRHLVINV